MKGNVRRTGRRNRVKTRRRQAGSAGHISYVNRDGRDIRRLGATVAGTRREVNYDPRDYSSNGKDGNYGEPKNSLDQLGENWVMQLLSHVDWQYPFRLPAAYSCALFSLPQFPLSPSSLARSDPNPATVLPAMERIIARMNTEVAKAIRKELDGLCKSYFRWCDHMLGSWMGSIHQSES
jgi:hypothetical protein